jgi:hypothetical protein
MPRKNVRPPKPDLKSATRDILFRTADWLEQTAVFVESTQRHSKAEWDVLHEAHALAVAYIRKGAEG